MGIQPHQGNAENGTEDKYYKKYNAILRRCSSIQRENEMLVNRVYRVKNIVRQLRKERKYLMAVLDKRGDNYRNLPLTVAINEEEKTFSTAQHWSLPALGRPRSSSSTSVTGAAAVAVTPPTPPTPTTSAPAMPITIKKQTPIKKERNMSESSGKVQKGNAFLYFCAEQREATTTAYVQQTGRTIDKKQPTKLLAQRWNALPEKEKKVYIDRVDKIKEEAGVKTHDGIKIE